jgi:hypothetical protein
MIFRSIGIVDQQLAQWGRIKVQFRTTIFCDVGIAF